MRILVVQESNWPEKGPHQSHHLMERLAARGHTVRVIDFDILWRDKEIPGLLTKRAVFEGVRKATMDQGVTVIRPPFVKLPVLEYISLTYYHRKEIRNQIRAFRPDVVVGFGILNAFISIRECRRHRIPFIYYVIDELHRLVPQRAFRRLARVVERSNLAAANSVLTINERLRDYAISMNSSEEHTMIIRAGVEKIRFNRNDTARSSIRARFGFDERDTVLFFMGWLYDFSGLLEVAKELTLPKWRDSNLKLMIVGSGPLWKSLQRLKSGLLGERLVLIDWLPYSEIPNYVLASDICILPAHKNDVMKNIVPIKVYEYMAAGKPVIATRLPGLLKEFGEGNGLTYVDRSEDTLRTAKDLAQYGLMETLGAKARMSVQSNDWGKITDNFEEVLTDAIGTRNHEG